jgi:hypothetical protein
VIGVFVSFLDLAGAVMAPWALFFALGEPTFSLGVVGALVVNFFKGLLAGFANLRGLVARDLSSVPSTGSVGSAGSAGAS